MTTLDGVERTFDARCGAGLRPRRPHGDRRDHGRPGLRGQRRDDPGPARGRDLERGQHPAHLAQARPALRRLEPVREAAASGARAARPAGGVEADGRALRGAARPGDDRRRRRDPGPPPGPPARLAGRAAARDADPGRTAGRVPAPARVRGRAATATTSRRSVPFHRHYDVTREADLVEEVGRIHGYAKHLPSTLPAIEQARRAHPRAAAAPPGRGRDPRPRLRPGRHAEPRRPRVRRRACGSRPTDPRAQPIADHQPALARALGPADDAARRPARRRPLQPRPRRGARRAGRVGPRVSAPRGDPPPRRGRARLGRELPRRAAGARLRALADRGARDAASCPAAGAASRVEPDFYALKGALEALAAQLGCSRRGRGRERAVPAPGPGGRILVAGEPAGWIGEVHPLVCRAWDLEAATGVRARPGAAGLRRRRSARSSTRT